ncbi:NnrS family protein [Rhodopseudomonas sp.]|uniref:NnrS family protein n=1 Tax=Rhodopseudomonas sp. TaxID=1078 RepID=UPI0039E60C82
MTITADGSTSPGQRTPLYRVLGDEGFRIFFPLAALHLALWPVLWTLVNGNDLPLARTMPAGLWHAQEMLIGSFGAALIGFMTTAVPEWTDTIRLQQGRLFVLAAVWGGARLVGLLGADLLTPLAALLDAVWLGVLVVYLLGLSWRKRTTRLLGFAGWIAAMLLAMLAMRYAFWRSDIALAQMMARIITLVWCGVLGLALARITVPVTNHVLDPSLQTTPYRPHPGRLNLGPGLAAVAIAGELAGLSPAVSGFLWIAAGAAFMDRVSEAFIGREMWRAEIMALSGASAMTGAGLMMVGASRLGLPLAESTGVHVVTMGGLGLGIMSVFSIAGLMHTGQNLPIGRMAKAALLLVIIGLLLRIAPDLDWFMPPGRAHELSSVVWAAAFLLWLKAYAPAISDRSTIGAVAC